MEWEAQDEGFMAKILVDAGAKDVAVGTPVAVVCEEKDDVSLLLPVPPVPLQSSSMDVKARC